MKRSIFLLLIVFICVGLFSQIQPINVVSPNGGESWAIETTHNITWITTLTTGLVRIYLVRMNSTAVMTTIAINIPVTSQAYSWAIPASTLPATDYKIGIAMMSNTLPGNSFYDLSDGVFAITNIVPPLSVTVLSPNGGEVWQSGSAYPITWTSYNLTGIISIYLLAGSSYAPYLTIAENVPIADGSYQWQIPASIPEASNYRIRIVWISVLDVYIADESDATFTIVTPGLSPSITVLSPNGGEIWDIGNTYPINWTYFDLTGTVRIDLVSPMANCLPTQIAEVPIESCLFNWTIPNTVMPGEFYRIAITWVSVLTVYFGDVSDANFTIRNPGAIPTVTVVSPNGREHWRQGDTRIIRWNSVNSSTTGSVDIYLFRGGLNDQVPYLISSGTPNDGFFSWAIPYNIQNGRNYKVRVRSLENLQCYDFSDAYFAIFRRPVIVSIVPQKSGNGVAFSIETDASRSVSADIYNIKGQCVTSLLRSEKVDGRKDVLWDGCDQNGRNVSKGVYFIKVTSGKEVFSRKFIY